MTLFDRIWQLPNTYVDSGRLPGYVGAVRIEDRVEVQAVGRTDIERDSGTIALDEEIARWLPEAQSPRVLIAADAPLDYTTTALRDERRHPFPAGLDVEAARPWMRRGAGAGTAARECPCVARRYRGW
jgi:hypothetical protein